MNQWVIHWKTKYLSIKHKAHPPATAQRGLLKYVRSCHLHAVYSEITALLRMKSKVWIGTSHKVLHGLVLADSAHNTYLLPLIDSLLAWKKPSELLYRTLHLSFQQTSNISTSGPKWPVSMNPGSSCTSSSSFFISVKISFYQNPYLPTNFASAPTTLASVHLLCFIYWFIFMALENVRHSLCLAFFLLFISLQ